MSDAKPAGAAQDNTWTVDLQHDFTLRGTKLAKLSFRRPKTKDVRQMSKGKGNDVDKAVHMLAALSLDDMAPSDIDELDAEDFAAIGERLGEIMGNESQT